MTREMADAAHQHHSSLREKVVEHVFVGEALRTLWRRGVYDAEVLRGEFDAHGYDLVMARGAVLRHIQFKTGVQARPRVVKLAAALETKPSGCAIWIQVNNALDLVSFLWLGGPPGTPIPPLGDTLATRIGRRATGERPKRANHREVPGARFTRLADMDAVLEALFGTLPRGTPPPVDEAAASETP